jgi:phospholipid/cholesterol/gamma-HCH transport system substrate-binding protein
MDINKKREIKVGAISIIAILLLVLGISLGKSVNVPGTTQTVRFVFPNSGGIKSGMPIVVNGVERGKVSTVRNIDNAVYIAGDIDNVRDLKNDASAIITILEITGGKKIEIFPGTSDVSYNTKDTIYGETPPDIAGLITLVGEIGADASILIKRIDSIAEAANTWIVEDQALDKLTRTIDNADELTSKINTFADNNLYKLEASVSDISILTRDLRKAIETNSPKIDDIVNNLDKTITEARGLISTTDSTITNANALISDIKMLTDDIKNGQGIVGKMIYDKELSDKLTQTITDLNEFIQVISEHGININARLGTRP